MELALTIIAACSVIRIVQNSIQLMAMYESHKATDKLQERFIDNLVQTDETFAKNFADEIERRYGSKSSNLQEKPNRNRFNEKV